MESFEAKSKQLKGKEILNVIHKNTDDFILSIALWLKIYLLNILRDCWRYLFTCKQKDISFPPGTK